MKEIHFNTGFPTDEWVAVGEIKKKKLPIKSGKEAVYIPQQFKILEGECEGMEISPKATFIEIRKRKVIYGK